MKISLLNNFNRQSMCEEGVKTIGWILDNIHPHHNYSHAPALLKNIQLSVAMHAFAKITRVSEEITQFCLVKIIYN